MPVPSDRAILGALHWLRNHYELGKPSMKWRVLRRIDRLLKDSCAELSFCAAEFRADYPDEVPEPGDFVDRYMHAQRFLEEGAVREVVARNSSDNIGEIHRVEGESDADLVRRIVATYLAISSTN